MRYSVLSLRERPLGDTSIIKNRSLRNRSVFTRNLPLKSILLLSFLSLFTGSVDVSALSERTLNDRATLEVAISKTGLTRIAVQGDRISNVFGLMGEFLMEADEDQGQIFIRPQGMDMDDPISLTITTEEGRTQDLRLIPEDKVPEAILLVSKESLIPRELIRTKVSREDVIELLAACREGSIPQGYTLRKVSLQEQTGVLPILRELSNGQIKIQQLEILNQTPMVRDLAPSDYGDNSDVIAVWISKHNLHPGEKGDIYVVRDAQ